MSTEELFKRLDAIEQVREASEFGICEARNGRAQRRI